ncbi:MAG: TldD/PmbA family protein [Gemmatimonadales bacterium]
MNPRLLDGLARRASRGADVVVKTDETVTLAIAPEGETRVTVSRVQSTHVRVVHEGRVGYAATTGEGDQDLVDQALAASASGAELELFFPMPAPLPAVTTSTPQAAAADAAALDALARALLERLRRTNRRVEVWAERSSGTVQVANTRGVLAGYDITLAGAGAVVESIGAGYAPPCRLHTAGAALPGLPELEGLVAEVDRRLDPPLLAPVALPDTVPVCLAPRAAARFLAPLRAIVAGYDALLDGAPLQDRLGEPIGDPRFSLLDDPLQPGRPGSRPIDDDGVVSRRVSLVERGRLAGFLADLELGARTQVPATGHAWRRPGSGSRIGFTNLRVLPGIETPATLLTMMGRGLLIADLEWSGRPNPLPGIQELRSPWVYLVENGIVKGRLEGIRLAGNVFAALSRIGAVGEDATWIGAACVPSVLVEGLTVLRS